MNNNKIAIAILNGVTAIVCSVAVAVAGFSIVGKVCENQQTLAEIKSGSSAEKTYYDNSSVNDAAMNESVEQPDNIMSDDDGGTDVQQDEAVTGSTESVQGEDYGKVISVTSGLNSTDKAEVLKYYQLVMEKNNKDGLGHDQKMTLVKLDGGSGAIGKFVSWFEGVAKKVLSANSMSHEGLPGVPEQMKVEDFASAKAVNDGRYTTVTINIVEQTDGPYGKLNGGPVGRAIGVLDGVAVAVAAIDGLKADFENGKLFIHYKNPKVVIKVDNQTGSLVKGACTWGYQVHVDIQKLDVSMMGISLTLKGAFGIVEMTSSY